MKVKAIFFDIDGTLVSFDTHKIQPSTIQAIKEVRKKGIKTFIATGRPLNLIGELPGLEFDGYITLNGAYCETDKQTEIYKNPIPKNDLNKAIEYLETDNNPFACAFMTKNEIVVNRIDEKVRTLSEMVNTPLPILTPLEMIKHKEVLQINIFVNEEKEKYLMETVFTHCVASRWNPLFADVNSRENSKQTGIDKILTYYGLELSETMAFGDGGNDIPMLKHVATGIAMGNAGEKVKEAADYITTTVDDNGIYNALKYFSII
ncbi:Cof-type HAD-IIB family hydrolase [Coprobacter tertius]|uniref:Cof-type HAD-IIB family hydrolase n=1 Tax=Coprobacter tertius TaxID=2944915 RepID=A0ABT1MN03_9BACT|nr:Cof-type HAD-IIB family hydrolase [Coprobacter tertius]MCP9612666.1 Cof-type HAD-IIB family hydrolase [Coprobacter tertius]